MPIVCPVKRAEYNKKYRSERYANDAAFRAAAKRRARERFTRITAELAAYKATLKCVMCGEDDSCCLEFHHVDPRTKDGNPSELARTKGWSTAKIIEHVETTCLCLCANCHRKAHHHIRQKSKGKPLKTKAQKKRYTSRPK